MYVHQTAAPAPPHSLPHMGINNHPPQPQPPHHHYTNTGYSHNAGQYHAHSHAAATMGGHHYPQQPMHSYTVNSHPHNPPPAPSLPRYGTGYNNNHNQAFNDFGMPAADGSGSSHPAHPSTVGGYPARGPPPSRVSGYQGFQGFPAQPPIPAPAPVPGLRGVEAIPQPVQRAAYQGPQFKTFAERKREREMELQRQADEAAAAQAPPPPPTPKAQPPPSLPPINTSNGLAYGVPSPVSPGQHAFAPGARTPSPAAMAMMGRLDNGLPSSRPTPPPRSMSGPPPQSPGGRALPTPRGASGPSPVSNGHSRAQHPAHPAPPVPSIPQQYGRQVSPNVAPPPAASPSPHQQMRSPSPGGPPREHSAVPVPPPPSRSPAPPPVSRSPVPPPPSRSPAPPASPVRTIPTLPASVPRNAAVQALLERSDTISSVRSLDRGGFGPNRILPQPPVSVRSSMSLDRGSSPGTRHDPLPRRGVSPVPEEAASEITARMAGVMLGGVVTPTSRSPSPSPMNRNRPLPAEQTRQTPVPPSPRAPVITIGDAPAAPKSPVINVAPPPPPPVITVGPPPPVIIEPPAVPQIMVRSDSPTTPVIAVSPPSINAAPPPRPASPGFSYGGLPTIDVSSSNTAEISISVPSINVGEQSNTPRGPIPRRGHRSTVSPTRIEPDSAILCAGCEQPIIGRIVSAMKQRWHPQCFTCGVCDELLEHVSSYEHEGKPYCHLDYHDRFAHKCYHCATPIVDPRFITLNDEALGERYYHELHFFCSECGDPFLDPSKSSAAGTEFGNRGDEEGETNAFVIHKGHPYCERCHLRLHKPKCRECKQPIPDVAVSAMGAKYHKECFVCSNCSCPFANNLFFPREGKAFCTECFEHMTDM